MAKKKGGEFDDFDIDNLDMDFEDSFPDPFDDSRDPTTRFKAGFLDAVKTKSRNVSYYNKILKKALPKDYEDILDQLNGAYNKGEELYNNSSSKLKPALNAMKRGTKGLLGNSEKYLPKSLHNKLKEWAESSDEHRDSSMSPQQQRDAELTIGLTDVFATQLKEGGRQFEENKRRDLWRTAIEGKRHKRNMDGLESIRNGIGRLVGYQDAITIKYQRKSLELQYRQLFATKDQTEILTEKANKTLEALGYITKNTGLPDAVKLRNTEAFKAQLRERFIGKIQQNTMGGIEGVIDRVSKNAKRMLNEKIDQFSMGVDAITSLDDMSEMMGGRAGMAGNMAGDAVMDQMASWLESPLGKFLRKNRKLTAGLARTKSWMNNAGAHATNFANSEDNTDHTTIGGRVKGGFIQTLKDLMRDTNRANIVHSDQSDYLNDASPFTMHTRKSITEVIPGFLARILREVTILRTKDESTPLLMYNYRRAKFTDRNKVMRGMNERLEQKNGIAKTKDRDGNIVTRTNTREAVDEVIAKLDKKNELSATAKEALRLQLVENSFRGEGFLPERFAEQKNYHNSITGRDRQELAAFVKKKFKVGTHRKLGEGSHIDKLTRDVSGRVHKLSASLDGILEEIHLQINNGNVEILEEMGFMHYKGNTHELNMDAIRAFILGMGEDGDAQTNSTNGPTNPNGPGSNGPNYRFVNNRTVRDFRRILSNYDVSDQRRDPVELFRDAANNAANRTFNQVRDASQKVRKVWQNRDQVSRIGKKKATRAYRRTKEQLKYQASLIRGELYNKYPELGAKVDSAIEQLVRHGASVTDATRQVAEEVNRDPRAFINKAKASANAFVNDKVDDAKIYGNHYADKARAANPNAAKKLDDAVAFIKRNTAVPIEQINTSTKEGKKYLNEVATKYGLSPAALVKAVSTEAPTMKPMYKYSGNSSSAFNRNFADQKQRPRGIPDSLMAIHNTLEEMKELLQAGIHVNSNGAGIDGRRFGFRYGLRSGLGKMLSGAGSLMNVTMRAYGSAFDLVRRGVTGTIGGAMTLAGKAFNGITSWQDIYVSGSDVPVLYAKGIRDGLYIDVNTGKVIKKLSHITGEVADISGIVLTKADFAKGLYTIQGKPVLRNIANKLVNFYGHLLSPIATAARLASKTMGWVYNKLTQEKDVYTKLDMSKPRLRVMIMQGGGYFSKHDPSKVIRKYADIDGAVVDRENNEVLSDAEIQAGLCDINGNPIRTLGDKLWGAATWGIRKSFGLAKGLAKYSLKFGMLGVKALAWGAVKLTNFFGRGLNLKPFESISLTNSNTQVVLLTKIRDILEERLPKRKKVAADTDGDGDRDGSWQDQQSNARQLVDEVRNKAEDAGKRASALFGGLATKLKGLLGKKKEGEEEEGEGDTTIIGGGLGGDGPDGHNRPPAENRPRGRMGRAWDKIKGWGRRIPGASRIAGAASWLGRGALAVGGMAMSISGLATVGGWLVTAAGAIGSAALAIISSPIVLGALAVAAVAGAGYLAYKYFSKPGASEFRNIRIAQYGVDPKNESQAGKVINLEKTVSSYVKLNGATASLELPIESLKRAAESMGVADNERDMKAFTKWMNERFKPVYIYHRACAEKLSPRATLDDMDAKFIKAQKLEAVKLLDKGLDWAPYECYTSPFEGPLSGGLAFIRDAFATARTVFAALPDSAPGSNTGRSNTVGAGSGAAAAGALAGANGIKGTGNGRGGSNNVAGKTVTQLNAESRGKVDFGIKGKIAASAPVSIYSAKNATPSSLDMVRFKAYGLVELDIDKVKTLRELERSLTKRLVYNSDNVASIEGDVNTFLSEFTSMFGIGMDDSARVAEWTVWFNKRFLPVFLVYCTQVKQADRTADVNMASTVLKPNLMLQIAQELIGVRTGGLFSTSVWGMTQSPWLNYTLNNDSSSTQANIAILEQMVKNRKYADDRMKATTDALLAAPKPNKPSSNILQEGRTLSPDAKPNIINGVFGNKSETVKQSPLIYPTAKGANTAKYGSKDYMMPATGRISSPFGDRDAPIAGASTDHKGIDIAAPAGTPVMACADGVIITRGFLNGYGNAVYIKHQDGKCSRYAHLSSFQTGHFVGKDVRKGDIIGYVGSTGNSSGNHLHFEIRESTAHDAKVLDPLKVIGDAKAIAEIKELKGYGKDTEGSGDGIAKAAGSMGNAMQPKVTNAAPIANVSKPEATAGNTADTGYGGATQTAAVAAQQTRQLVQERNKASDIKVTADVSELVKILDRSYNVQVEMRDELKKLNSTMASQKDAASANATSANKPGKRPTETAMKPNPISVKKIEVA